MKTVDRTRKNGIMQAVVVPILLMAVVVAGGCTAGTGEVPAGETLPQTIEDITVQEAAEMIEERRGNADFAIIDVRTPEEFAEGYIEGAVLVNFQDDDFRDKVGELDRDKTRLIYCRSGARSAGARDVMAELGFREVYNMLGGILGWEAAGHPVVR
jgi:rhodanese-related sulfurtransferase